MPVTDFRIENRIFFARQSGVLTSTDAMQWVDYLAQKPIKPQDAVVALVDAREVTFAPPDAMYIFVQASYCSKLLAVIVVVSPYNMEIARVYAELDETGKTQLFTDYDQALAHASELLASTVL